MTPRYVIAKTHSHHYYSETRGELWAIDTTAAVILTASGCFVRVPWCEHTYGSEFQLMTDAERLDYLTPKDAP